MRSFIRVTIDKTDKMGDARMNGLFYSSTVCICSMQVGHVTVNYLWKPCVASANPGSA